MDAKEFGVCINILLVNSPYGVAPRQAGAENLSDESEGNKRFPAVHRFAQ